MEQYQDRREIGIIGDCGNYAIAFHEVYGGQFWGFFLRDFEEDEPVLEHVVIKLGEYVYDAQGVSTISRLGDFWTDCYIEEADLWIFEIAFDELAKSHIPLNKSRITFLKAYIKKTVSLDERPVTYLSLNDKIKSLLKSNPDIQN